MDSENYGRYIKARKDLRKLMRKYSYWNIDNMRIEDMKMEPDDNLKHSFEIIPMVFCSGYEDINYSKLNEPVED